MAHDSIFVHHCNCITDLLISGFASAAIRLSFDRGPDMLIDVVSSNKRIKFIRANMCKLEFLLRHLSVTNRELCRSVPFLLSIFLSWVYLIRSPTQKPGFYLLRKSDGICEKLQSSLVGCNRALFFVFSSKIR